MVEFFEVLVGVEVQHRGRAGAGESSVEDHNLVKWRVLQRQGGALADVRVDLRQVGLRWKIHKQGGYLTKAGQLLQLSEE